ncbi:Hypothetical predicted protein, partial [Pelobates cultripes]
ACEMYQHLQNTPDETYLQLSTMLERHRIRSLTSLTKHDDPTTMQTLLYAQVTHFIRNNPTLQGGSCTLSDFEIHCKANNVKTKQLSTFYKLLGSDHHNTLPKFTDSWSTDLGI